MKELDAITRTVEEGGRISAAEALALWNEAPLWSLARLAMMVRRRHNGDVVYYNRNFHIEPSNICLFNCKFCSYRRNEGEEGAWDLSLDEVAAIARSYHDKNITEIHIVGSVHPRHGLDYWLEMVRIVRSILPATVSIKAFSAVELARMITAAGLDYPAGLRLLREAGVDAIPGGGAEIFDPEVRRLICPEKIDADRWLALHEAAHGAGVVSNATMLYGHIETPAQRIDHLGRLRDLQDRTGGFNAFIPLKFRAAGNRLSHLGEVGIVEDMKTVALSRIFLDNFAHIKAYWPMYGKAAAEMALGFGADDLDGTIDDTTRIYSMAGSEELAPSMSAADVERMATAAGLRAVERDTFYNEMGRMI